MANRSLRQFTTRLPLALKSRWQLLPTEVQAELTEAATRIRQPNDRTAWLYLIAICLAEGVISWVDPILGLVGYSLVLLSVFYQVAQRWDQPMRPMLLSLAFPSLIRFVGMTFPLEGASRINWYLFTGLLLIVAGLYALPSLNITRDSAGLRLNTTWGNRRLQIAIALLGLPIGYLTSIFLQPRPFLQVASWRDLILPALILLIASGFAEEFIYRGIMQRTAVRTLGRYGVIYTSLLFTALHLSYGSIPYLLLIFGASMIWGWTVERTRSLVGVSLSHGIVNIVLFLLIPYLQLFQ